MKWILTSLAFIFVLLLSPNILADDTPKELKRQLFERYDQKNLSMVHDKILVALLAQGPGFNSRGRNLLEYSVNYDYFDQAISKQGWPKKYQNRNLLNEFTTEEVTANARLTDTLTIGEMVQTRLFYVESRSGFLLVDMYLVPLAGKRTASTQNIYEDGSAGVSYKVDWGCHFRFLFPPKDPISTDQDYYDYITERIGEFFQPTDEYLRIQKESRAVDPAAVPGKYIDDKNESEFFELKPDHTYFERSRGHDYTGTYEVSGDKVQLIQSNGIRIRLRLVGDRAIFGSRSWMKQQGAEAKSPPPTPTEALTNDDVMRLVQAKLPDAVVTSKIKSSSCNFDTRTETIIKLKAANLSGAVLQAMIECPQTRSAR
jgi:hypothetical protein